MKNFTQPIRWVELFLLGGLAACLTCINSTKVRAADQSMPMTQPTMPATNGMPMPGAATSTANGTGGAMQMGMPYEVPASLPTPSVAIQVMPDSEGGWNLHIMVKNFTFSGEHAGSANVPGEGHGHILVDGKMVGRAYGEWVYLSAADVPAGAHTLTLRLETNDHRDYLVGGKQVEASAKLAGM